MSKELMNKGWDDMKSRLDNEMPIAKRKRRPVLFFWLFIGLLSGIGSYYYLSTAPTESAMDVIKKPIKTIASAEANPESSNGINSNNNSAVTSSNNVNTDDNKQIVNEISPSLSYPDPENSSITNSSEIVSFNKDRTTSIVTKSVTKEKLTAAYQTEHTEINRDIVINNDTPKPDDNHNKLLDKESKVTTPDLLIASPISGRAGSLDKDIETSSVIYKNVYKLDFLPSIIIKKIVSFSNKNINHPMVIMSNPLSKFSFGLYIGAGNSFGSNDMQAVRFGAFLNRDITPKVSLQMGADLGFVRTDFNASVDAEEVARLQEITNLNLVPTSFAIQVDNIILANFHAKALYHISPKWSLIGGIEVANILDYKRNNTLQNNVSISAEADLLATIYNQVSDKIVNRWDILPVVGVQYNLNNHIGLKLNYAHGMRNIFNPNIIEFNTQKRKEIKLLCKYMF